MDGPLCLRSAEYPQRGIPGSFNLYIALGLDALADRGILNPALLLPACQPSASPCSIFIPSISAIVTRISSASLKFRLSTALSMLLR